MGDDSQDRCSHPPGEGTCVTCSGTLRVSAGKRVDASGLEVPEVVNLLQLRPKKKCRWRRDKRGNVVLEVKRFKRPWSLKLGYFLDFKLRRKVRLDDKGTAVWTLMDGKRTMGHIGEVIEARFGPDEQLFQRLADFLQMLEINGLVEMRRPGTGGPRAKAARKRRASGRTGSKAGQKAGSGRATGQKAGSGRKAVQKAGSGRKAVQKAGTARKAGSKVGPGRKRPTGRL